MYQCLLFNILQNKKRTKTFETLTLNVAALGFSNSLIIHQEKTKKITPVTVVWICVPNHHKILPTLALNFSKNY